MNYEDIIYFLEKNQPFQNEENIAEEDIDMYKNSLKYLDEVYADERF